MRPILCLRGLCVWLEPCGVEVHPVSRLRRQSRRAYRQLQPKLVPLLSECIAEFVPSRARSYKSRVNISDSLLMSERAGPVRRTSSLSLSPVVTSARGDSLASTRRFLSAAVRFLRHHLRCTARHLVLFRTHDHDVGHGTRSHSPTQHGGDVGCSPRIRFVLDRCGVRPSRRRCEFGVLVADRKHRRGNRNHVDRAPGDAALPSSSGGHW